MEWGSDRTSRILYCHLLVVMRRKSGLFGSNIAQVKTIIVIEICCLQSLCTKKRRSLCPVLLIKQYMITMYQATWQPVSIWDVKNNSRLLPAQLHLSQFTHNFFHILSPSCTRSIGKISLRSVSPRFSVSCDWL